MPEKTLNFRSPRTDEIRSEVQQRLLTWISICLSVIQLCSFLQ